MCPVSIVVYLFCVRFYELVVTVRFDRKMFAEKHNYSSLDHGACELSPISAKNYMELRYVLELISKRPTNNVK